jgi:CcmD family protein
MTWVYAAYTATWVVLIAYIVMLNRGYQKVRADIEELEQEP